MNVKHFDNIAFSDELIALIFADCLISFPTPIEIDVRSIIKRLSKERAFTNVPEHWLENCDEFRPPELFYDLDDGDKPVCAEGDSRDIRNVLHDLLSWLHDNDFIRYKPNFGVKIGSDGQKFVNLYVAPSRTILTQKALVAMRNMPASLDAQTTFGDFFKSYANEAGKHMTKSTLGEIVKQVIGHGIAG